MYLGTQIINPKKILYPEGHGLDCLQYNGKDMVNPDLTVRTK